MEITKAGLEQIEWYKAHNCTHAHCPFRCQHPQPFLHDGKLYCGKHWHDDQELVEMVPCTPENCEED